VKLFAAFDKNQAYHICLLPVVAVTFGTVASSSSDVGFTAILRFEDLSFSLSLNSLVSTTQAQSIHYLVVTFDICALQIVQHTSSLRDHLEQAAPRVIVFLVSLEMFGKLVDTLA
jgi:hypothetical protein